MKKYVVDGNRKAIQEQYTTYMIMDDATFAGQDVSSMIETQRLAYVMADYFRDLRVGLKDVTTDPEVNALIDNVWKLFPRMNTADSIEALSNQIRNYEPFTMIDDVNRQRIFRVKETNEYYQVPVL